MEDSNPRPGWLNDAQQWYYSQIDYRPRRVTILAAADGQEVSDGTPGTPILRLDLRFGTARIVGVDERDHGVIRSEGTVPGLRFTMRRNDTLVWALTVRSIVRKRHQLAITDGDTWTFDTPFYWWQHLTGAVAGEPKLLGGVGPSKQYWGFWVEPARDTPDLLAAVAFMHWKWWRW